MLLTLHALNSDATLNNFTNVQTIEFAGGASTDFVFQLIQPDKSIRYIPNTGSTASITFKNSDNSTFTINGTFIFPDDRSIIKVSLTPAQTLNLISQYIKVVLTEGSTTSYAVLETAIQRIVYTCVGV